MQQEDRKRFGNALMACAEMYGKKMSDALIALYWQGLSEYDVEAVERAIAAHMRNPDSGQWMPKIADIIRLISGTTSDAALLAWAKVDKAVRHVGTYESVVFDDPIIHQTLRDMGGWIQLGTKTDEEWPFVAKEFENRYRGYRSRPRGDYPRSLAGICEIENEKNGHRVAPPLMIGSENACQQVYLGGSEKPALEIKPLPTSVGVVLLTSVPTEDDEAA